MNIISLSLSFIGSSYLPIILVTLILGFLVLIVIENNKFSSSEEDENTDWKDSVDKFVNSEDEKKSEEKVEVSQKDIEDKSKSEKVSDTDSSHSHNEDKEEDKEDEEKSKVKVKKIKKIGCSSSANKSGGCSTRKKKVEEVIILSFSSDEECATKFSDCLEDDITCRIKLLNSEDFDIGYNKYKDAVDLCFILLTSEENIKQVESLIENHSMTQKLECEENHLNSFSYSILYINQETQDLKVLEDALNSIGGEMWQSSVNISEDKQTIESQVLEEFSNSLLKDIKKSRKKCCGTSCKTKTTDIEDLLPVTTAVET